MGVKTVVVPRVVDRHKMWRPASTGCASSWAPIRSPDHHDRSRVPCRRRRSVRPNRSSLGCETMSRRQNPSEVMATARSSIEEWLEHSSARGRAPRPQRARQSAERVTIPALDDVLIVDLAPRHLNEIYGRLVTGEERPRPLKPVKYPKAPCLAVGLPRPSGTLSCSTGAPAERTADPCGGTHQCDYTGKSVPYGSSYKEVSNQPPMGHITMDPALRRSSKRQGGEWGGVEHCVRGVDESHSERGEAGYRREEWRAAGDVGGVDCEGDRCSGLARDKRNSARVRAERCSVADPLSPIQRPIWAIGGRKVNVNGAVCGLTQRNAHRTSRVWEGIHERNRREWCHLDSGGGGTLPLGI